MQSLGVRDTGEHSTPRKRTWPVALSILVPGIGHLAVGAYRRGWAIIASLEALAWVAVGACALAWPWIATSLILLGLILRIFIGVDTWRVDGSLPRPKLWTLVAHVIAILAATGVSSSLRHELVAESYEVPGPSMSPTLMDGDHVVVAKFGHDAARGELVSYVIPGQPGALHIKRVVGLEGDTVRLDSRGLFVNGEPSQPTPAASSPPTSTGEWVVGEGEAFVLGDNLNESLDSRHVGGIPLAAIVGKPTFLWWSTAPDGLRWSRTLKSVR